MGNAKNKRNEVSPATMSKEEKESLLDEYADIHMNVYEGVLSDEDASRATELRAQIMVQMTAT